MPNGPVGTAGHTRHAVLLTRLATYAMLSDMLSEMTARISIRKIQPTDAAPAAALSAELGYPVNTEVMAERIAVARRQSNRAVFVACSGDGVVGWIDVSIGDVLSTGSYGEIRALVVSNEHRSGGIGGQLVRQAEDWVSEKGLDKVTVRSRMERERAHEFYLRLGYIRSKISAVFAKELRRPEGDKS